MLRALVVADNELICWGLERILSSQGMLVTIVDNGKDALSETQDASYNLVFLDINLPDMSGLDVLAGIRRASPTLEVVIMASDVNGDDIKQALEKGASQFLEKPFDVYKVNDIVKKMSFASLKRRERFTL